MGKKEEAKVYKLLLQSVKPENIADIRDEIRKLLDIGEGQANDIMSSVPIILLDEIPDKRSANQIKKKFNIAEELGAGIVLSKEPLEDMPRLKWPETPEIARVGEEKKEISEDALTLAKYNFVVDRRNVFRCPGCDKLFLIRELSEEEAAEAEAQYEIADRLMKKRPSAPGARGRRIEEIEPIQELEPHGGLLSTAGDEIIDLATFEEGLSSIEEALPETLPSRPEAAPAAAKSARGVFQELESLPSEGPDSAEEAAAAPAGQRAETAQKESELEELAPEEALKFFGERHKDEADAHEDSRKVVAPRRGAARRRMQRLRDKQDEKEKRGPAGRRKHGKEEEPQEEPQAEVDHTEGFHGVVLSRIGSGEKKRNAARLIVELTSVHPQEARDMCEGVFVNVIRSISEEEANEIAAKFREMGVAAKVTLQKRKRRQSERKR